MTILYIMLHLPCPWWIKIGITGKSTRKRATGVTKSKGMWGWAIPIFGLPIPFAEAHETMLHRQCKAIKAPRFNQGSGKSEWFWFPAVVPVVLVWAWWAAVYVAMFYATIFMFKSL